MDESQVLETGRRIERELNALIAGIERDVSKLQGVLAAALAEELVSRLKVEAKQIQSTVPNINQAQRIDKVFDDFYKNNLAPLLKKFAQGLLKAFELAREYFLDLGFEESKLKKAAGQIAVIKARIGIDEKGKIVPGGNIDRLAKSESVRDELRRFVLNSVTNKVSLSAFQKGIRLLVTTGDTSLVSYWRQYAFDMFNQIHEIGNKSNAESLGLEFFIYEGSLIATSRAFCVKRAGKVFHVSETDSWKNDPDLIDKKTAATYQPLIERGRYNCRHMIRYISQELALRLRPDAKKFVKG